MKLAFSTLGCPEWDIHKVAEMARKYGFDGVELRVWGRQHVDIDMTLDERVMVRELFEHNKVAICCLSSYVVLGGYAEDQVADSVRKLKQVIDLAADLHAPAIRIFAEQPEGTTIAEAARNVASALSPCREYAANKGVSILIETHHGFKSGNKMTAIFEQMKDCDEVAAIWDMHHTLSEGESPEETYRLLGSKVRHVHLKDAIVAEDAEDKICLVGQGSLPIGEVVDLLKQREYKGFLSLEWEKTWIKELEDPEIAFPHYIRYIRGIMGR